MFKNSSPTSCIQHSTEVNLTYKPLEVLGPEHEYALVDRDLSPLPISDKVIKGYCGKMVNFIEFPGFSFGKEMQLHVMEIKANTPFKSPCEFEETMQDAVSTLNGIVERYGACLLGTGMHPLLKLADTSVWPHHHRRIYQAYGKIFDLQRHGWLNIQSFHLNLPYQTSKYAAQIHNQLANLCTYLPAIAASSPIFEGKEGSDVDNRLRFYKENQREVPSVAGEVIPDYIGSLADYSRDVIGHYSADLAAAGADKVLLGREWVNSRGVIVRFDRRALEVRVMDEQECVKADVSLACFVRAALRGLLASDAALASHEVLVKDFNAVIRDGLDAQVLSPHGATAREVCRHYLKLAYENADVEEKKYLPLVSHRVEEGSLSELIKTRVQKRAEKTVFHEAVRDVYSTLIKCLCLNEPF
ncbi:MAG: glutamate-cysteine ligase family protein [Methanocella sp.]|jgi:gamma-glutamyl:cysteine ligase YbdK (ATP-grasp superfamily)